MMVAWKRVVVMEVIKILTFKIYFVRRVNKIPDRFYEYYERNRESEMISDLPDTLKIV